MRQLLGVAMVFGDIVLGLWLGIWVLFIGGIVSFVEAAKANPVDAYQLAWGIFKVLVAIPVGGLTIFICAVLGTAIIEE